MTIPSSLVALHKAGNQSAAGRLVEVIDDLPEKEMPAAIDSLKVVGQDEVMYKKALERYRKNRSRRLLKQMLTAQFTTLDWDQLWTLPGTVAGSENAYTTLDRARDVRELAEHMSGTKITFEPCV